MSDTSEDLAKERSEGQAPDSVCRDFLRGMCERKFCKYKHEHEIKTLNFCHDFQNATCPRPSCKFIHCSPQEVEDYKRSGEMSNQILAEATRKNQLPGLMPICNAFRKGQCRRPFCKYRHVSKEEEEAEIMELIKNNSMKTHVPSNNIVMINDTHNTFFENEFGVRRPFQFEETDEFGPTMAKRRLISNGLECSDLQTELARRNFKGYFAGNPPPMLNRLDPRSFMLEEENNLLHKEIAQLKKQVSDLTATNEFLLDQNANLRVSSKRNGSVTVPAVTITNTLPQNNQGQVIRTVAASVATVPVSLATVTTCNPVSGNPVSIAGCPSVSIAPAAQILAPSQQILVTTNQPTQLALANSSQAQLAIAQQNLANNLAQQQAPQLTTSQAQHMAALAGQSSAAAAAQQQLNQQLTSQAQQLALANTTQQLTSQAQQLALANTTQQLTSQAQQLALANTPQQLAVASVPQQLALATAAGQQLQQQMSQMNGISTSQAIAMSNATQPMVSYPIMTHAALKDYCDM